VHFKARQREADNRGRRPKPLRPSNQKTMTRGFISFFFVLVRLSLQHGHGVLCISLTSLHPTYKPIWARDMSALEVSSFHVIALL